jgi:methyl-CpG-binding domain protein 4
MVEPPLLQLEYRHEPWRLLVVCVLLNVTSARQAEPVARVLFRRWPDARAVAAADPAELERVLRSLGLARRRSETLQRLSADWLLGRPVEACYGVGPFAHDAYRLLVAGDLDVDPSDRFLREWLAWRRRDENA